MRELDVIILREQDAKEICSWKYEGDYAVYNFSDWGIVVENKWDLAIKESREANFLAILQGEELIAFGRISFTDGKVNLGVGLKPSFCGKGYGGPVMKLLIDEAKTRFPGYVIMLEVRAFNERAIACYRKVGFNIKDHYMKKTFDGLAEYVYMEYLGE